MPYRVSQDQFSVLVEKALADLPPEFAEFIEEVPIEICPQATPRQRALVGLSDDRQLLLGLYRGRMRTTRSVEDSGRLPDVIYIFQLDIERMCSSEIELVRQVRKTVLHEIGHHFGMSEQDLERLGYG